MSAKEYEIFILPDGTVRFVYYDELEPILSVGKPQVRRVSHVDAVIVKKQGLRWFADLYPVKGPKLGPFKTRELAIQSELEWLSENLSKLPL